VRVQGFTVDLVRLYTSYLDWTWPTHNLGTAVEWMRNIIQNLQSVKLDLEF